MFGFFKRPEPVQLTDKHKQSAQDYALLMLGAPVIKVELDQSQLDLCAETAVDCLKRSTRVQQKDAPAFLQEGVLIHAKLVLGRIRNKYNPVPGPGGGIYLDGASLLSEGTRDLMAWKIKLGIP